MFFFKKDRDTVFISYAHADSKYLDELKTHLTPFARNGIIDYWDDTRIKTGDEWKSEIALALERAKVAVLLVSPNFFASKFIAENELPPLLEASTNDGLKIFQVIVRESAYFASSPLEKYQAINDPHRPLSVLKPNQRDRIWTNLVNQILDAIPTEGSSNTGTSLIRGASSVSRVWSSTTDFQAAAYFDFEVKGHKLRASTKRCTPPPCGQDLTVRYSDSFPFPSAAINLRLELALPYSQYWLEDESAVQLAAYDIDQDGNDELHVAAASKFRGATLNSFKYIGPEECQIYDEKGYCPRFIKMGSVSGPHEFVFLGNKILSPFGSVGNTYTYRFNKELGIFEVWNDELLQFVTINSADGN